MSESFLGIWKIHMTTTEKKDPLMLEKREKEKQYEQRLETFSRSNMQAYWPEMLFSLTFIHKCMRVSVVSYYC